MLSVVQDQLQLKRDIRFELLWQLRQHLVYQNPDERLSPQARESSEIYVRTPDSQLDPSGCLLQKMSKTKLSK